MFKNIQTHKPGKSGLCVYSLIVFLFFIVNAFALTSCDNNAIEDDPNPENNDSIPKEEDVIVLSPEDIIDYDKFYKPTNLAGWTCCETTADGHLSEAGNLNILSFFKPDGARSQCIFRSG